MAAAIMTGMNDSGICTVFHPDWWDRIVATGQVDALQDWLRSNGLEPRDVDLAPITVEHRDGAAVIRYTAALRDADGFRYRDPVTDGAAREERTVPLLVEPPQEFGTSQQGGLCGYSDTNAPSPRRGGGVKEGAMSDGLVQFLRDRLDEDFEAVRLVFGVNVMAAIQHGEPAPRWVPSPKNDVGVWDTNRQPRVKYVWPRERAHIIRHDPARVLAEIEAKRGIIARYEFVCRQAAELGLSEEERETWVQVGGALQSCVLCLAAVYADHPDYREEWRP
ncbi:DUF6221 family protein [Streptomyces asiaticus]